MVNHIIKTVAILNLVIFTSSCAWYGASTRDVERCMYCTADPSSGTVEQAVRCNAENFHVNEKHCDAQFDQLDIK